MNRAFLFLLLIGLLGLGLVVALGDPSSERAAATSPPPGSADEPLALSNSDLADERPALSNSDLTDERPARSNSDSLDEGTARSNSPAPRLVSLNPSLTAIVVRLAGPTALVGVDDYSAQVVPEVAAHPRVGGLFDPSLEAVVALRPDRVLMVEGALQESHGDRLEALGLRVEIYSNERLDEVLENIERLGRLLTREKAAEARIQAIMTMRRAVRVATAARPRPRTIAVVDRSPLYLVGAETFLDEMLEAVGADNLGRELATGYPRGSLEWLIGARPDLLLDMTPGADAAITFWSRWPSLPAVATGRVLSIEARRVSLPGPDLDLALRILAKEVHGAEVASAIDAALVTGGGPS